jgi:hypothetical protein
MLMLDAVIQVINAVGCNSECYAECCNTLSCFCGCLSVSLSLCLYVSLSLCLFAFLFLFLPFCLSWSLCLSIFSVSLFFFSLSLFLPRSTAPWTTKRMEKLITMNFKLATFVHLCMSYHAATSTVENSSQFSLLVLSKVYHKIWVSFGLIQKFKNLDVAMVKVEKVNIAVTQSQV